MTELLKSLTQGVSSDNSGDASSAFTSATKSKSSSRKKSSSLPPDTVEYLKAWMMSPEHIAHPYPTEQEKAQIMADTGIELKQLTNWFVNNRKRYWKPRVEARLHQQAQAHAAANVAVVVNQENDSNSNQMQKRVSIDHQKKVPKVVLERTRTVSVVASDLSTFVPSPVSARAVSDVSSSSSYSECASDHSNQEGGEEECVETPDDVVDNTVSRTEYTDLHILRPLSGSTPSVEDVSILANVPMERILHSYRNCMLAYSFSVDTLQDRKKVQSKRDAEIVRMKRRYLKTYLATIEPSIGCKRKEVTDSDDTPRKAYSRKCPRTWRDACIMASHDYDHSMPSFEEAVKLFGIGDDNK